MLEACFGGGAGCGFGCSLGAGEGVSGLDTGTRTLPSEEEPSSSSSSSDCALAAGDALYEGVGEVESGERDAANGLEEIETEEGAGWAEGVDGGANAAKSEFAASEKRREARFWLFVNL